MTTEIITPEVEVLDLDGQINSALVKHNLTDAIISELKNKYGNLVLKSIDDKESYLAIKEARKEVRKWGILTEKITKKGREEAVQIQKKWLAKEGEILKKISEIQDPLDAEIKKYEDEQERQEKEIQQKKEHEYMQRQSQIVKMGAVFANGNFMLEEISYEATNIRESDEETWNSIILPKYRKIYERIESEKAEKERMMREEQERLKKEKEKFEQEQAAFKKQQEEFADQQRKLDKQKEEAELERKRLQQEAENKLWRSRLESLDEIGWNGQFAFARLGNHENPVFTYDELVSLSDDDFNKRKDAYNNDTLELKRKQEEKRLADIEEQKRLAAEQERERIAEEQRQQEIKRQQEEARAAEELAKSSDKEKFAHFLSQLNKVALPEFKSSIYKGKLAIIKEKLEEINSL